MKPENISIEQVILNISKKIVDKKKTRTMFFIVFVIFSIIVYILLPEFRATATKNDSGMTYLAMCGIVSIAGVSLMFTILPARFNFHAKPKELIAVIDKAFDEYLTEMGLTLFRYKNSYKALIENKNIAALRGKKETVEHISEKIVKIERDITRINEHLETINEKSEMIKEKTVQLALAS